MTSRCPCCPCRIRPNALLSLRPSGETEGAVGCCCRKTKLRRQLSPATLQIEFLIGSLVNPSANQPDFLGGQRLGGRLLWVGIAAWGICAGHAGTILMSAGTAWTTTFAFTLGWHGGFGIDLGNGDD